MSVPTLLIYAKPTGHVLAATTLVAAPSGDVKPEAIAGQFLPVRYIGEAAASGYPTAQVFVPVDQLGVFATDSRTVSTGQARDWMIAVDSQNKKTLTPLPDKPLDNVSRTTTTLEVKATAPSSDPITVWARVQPANLAEPSQLLTAGQTVRMVTTPTPPGNTVDVTLTLVGLTPGQSYWALVLATGFPAHLESFTA